MKIVAAVDFSTATECILKAAKDYAKILDAEVYLVHVEPPESVDYDCDRSCICARDVKIESVRLQKNAKVLQRNGIKAIPVLLEGAIGKTILDETVRLEADLIIAGTHGHGLFHNRLVGSTSEEILRKSKIPVLLIPSKS
ncbi:MAG: universal stress protein [Kiritimatiellales bacterium]